MDQPFTFRNFGVLFFSLFVSANVTAQVFLPGFSVGVQAGGTQAFTDVTDADVNPSFGATVQYNVTSFSFATVEYSMGRLSRKELDIYGKSFTNNFKRITATANVGLGQLLNPDSRVAHYMFYNIYVGSGIGVIMSDIAEPNALTTDEFGGITYQGTDLAIPVNIGFNFKIGSYLYPDSPLNFNVNLQHNFGLTEMLDGYDPDNSDNKIKDSFTTLNMGVKYSFGK